MEKSTKQQVQEFEDWLHSLKPPSKKERASEQNLSPEDYLIPHNLFDPGELHRALFPGSQHPHPEESPVSPNLVSDRYIDPADPEHADLADIIEQIYGMDPSGLRNNRSVPGLMPRSRGELINTPLTGPSGNPLINVPLTGLPGGAAINVPARGLPRGGSIFDPITRAPGGSLINTPPRGLVRQRLLAALARNQAKAHGHHFIA
jgi:hypothetical protein